MIAIDTNILVRFLTKDDKIQYEKSLKIFHLSISKNCNYFYTFDKKFMQKSINLSNCQVKKPDI